MEASLLLVPRSLSRNTKRLGSFSFSLYIFLLLLQVVIVGNGAVGKSSMIQRYCKGTFTKDYKKTIGVDFLERHIEWVDLFKLVKHNNYNYSCLLRWYSLNDFYSLKYKNIIWKIVRIWYKSITKLYLH